MNTIDNKKETIKQVAFDFFLNRGYDATTLRMICKEAHVEAPTVYYYFGSKKGLFFALIDDFWNHYNLILESSMKTWGESPLEKLYGFYQFAINYSISHNNEIRFYLRYSLFRPIELNLDINAHMDKTNQAKRAIIIDPINDCIKSMYCSGNEEIAYQRYVNFIDSCTFNVIFSGWRPDNNELLENWTVFYENRIKSQRVGPNDALLSRLNK